MLGIRGRTIGIVAAAVVAASGCGSESEESSGGAPPGGRTATAPATIEGVRSCLQDRGLTIQPPPDSTGIDLGAEPIFVAAFPDSGQRSQIYVVDSEAKARDVETKAIDAVKVFGIADAEDYFVQIGNAVASFEDENAKPTAEQRSTIEACIVA